MCFALYENDKNVEPYSSISLDHLYISVNLDSLTNFFKFLIIKVEDPDTAERKKLTCHHSLHDNTIST